MSSTTIFQQITENCSEPMSETHRYVDVGISGICRTLAGNNDLHLPLDFRSVIYDSNTPATDLADAIARIRRANLSETFAANLAIHTMEEIHQEWMSYHSARFHDPTHRDARFLFMPLAAIGYEEASKYFKYLAPIMALLGVCPDTMTLRQAYEDYQDTYKLFRFCISMRNYVEKVLTTRGEHLSPTELDEIVHQIIQHNPSFTAYAITA